MRLKTIHAGRLALFALTALGSASTALAQVAFSDNWHTPNFGFSGGLVAFTGPGLFGALSGDGHYPTLGDSIRICYGIDSTQGGRNQDGFSDVTWFRLIGGYAPGNSLQAMEFGVAAFEVSSVDTLDGDACFSPFFGQAGQTGVTTAAFNIGVVPGSGGMPFPAFWELTFQFLGSTGLQSPNVLGTAPNATPLLANLIFEVQGAANNGPSANFYFLAATSELVGLGSGGTGTGGVTNGNGQQGSALSGLTADQSGAIAHYRLNATNPTSGITTGTFGIGFGGQTPANVQFFNSVATFTPQLWSANDGNTGAGGTDLRVGNAPVSTFQWRVIDQMAGADQAAMNPSLAANLPIVLYSVTPAASMLQTPMSWDDAGGTATPQPGSIALGNQLTQRAGAQSIPINFDPITNAFLSQTGYTVGSTFMPSTGNLTLAQTVGVGGPGSANMPAALPLTPSPNPALVGIRVGVAALGLQVDTSIPSLFVTEVASAMTLNLQP